LARCAPRPRHRHGRVLVRGQPIRSCSPSTGNFMRFARLRAKCSRDTADEDWHYHSPFDYDGASTPRSDTVATADGAFAFVLTPSRGRRRAIKPAYQIVGSFDCQPLPTAPNWRFDDPRIGHASDDDGTARDMGQLHRTACQEIRPSMSSASEAACRDISLFACYALSPCPVLWSTGFGG